MRTRVRMSTGLVLAAILSSGAAIGQEVQARCDRANTPERVEGRVVKVDVERGRVIVHPPSGADHEFNASRETLQDLRPGDRIEARLRTRPDCK